ncbi:MAG TPA: energy transducer TonB [Flavobacterium sp.]|uniref:energy transducer TonB n=1 Tax=Flavobacterium sp. TaxID=239 RepID=UPI002C254439|nr:energy transducer TonB [Flavobacterium sp.]HSD13273.1 energy transducer TonB [Flavobacterium sp.]
MKRIILLTLLFSTSLITAQPKVYQEKEVSTNPGFPGGWNSWIDFVEKNFKWVPEKNAKHVGIEFTVQTNGTITDIKVINPFGSPNEKEALRVMALSPKWSPATVNGKTVPCRLERGMFNPYFDDDRTEVITIDAPIDNYSSSTPEDDNKIYNSSLVEITPKFPGGIAKFFTFFNTNFKFPDDIEEDFKGKVMATFIIEKNGSLSDIRILRNSGYNNDKETIRVLKKSPKWIPGEQNGKKVRTQFTIPIPISRTMITQPEKK